MALNISNTSISELRAAWKRDWDRLANASDVSGGAIRHYINDRPEEIDPQIWEAIVRKDYINIADFYGLEPLETEAVVSL